MCNGGNVETARPLMRLDAEVVSSVPVGPGTRIVGFRTAERTVEPRPGQFYMLKILDPGFPLFGRAFSVFDFRREADADILEFLVMEVGSGTAMINAAEPGAAAMIVGPSGNGFPDIREGETTLLVGGGTGIAPFYHLLRDLADAGMEDAPIRLLHGARDADMLFIADRLEAFPFPVEFATEDGSRGTAGMVDAILRPRLDGDPDGGLRIFACGPDPMMRAVAHLGEAADVPVHLSLETRMACGTGICNGCAVEVETRLGDPGSRRFLRVCHEGTVFLSRSLPAFRRPS